MLFIYGCLGIGGIETFFVRIAKERHSRGLETKIILRYPEKSNPELLKEMRLYAKVFNYADIFNAPNPLMFFKLLCPIKNKSLKNLLTGITQIHVFQGDDALLAARLKRHANSNVPITVGFYHYVHYLWGGDDIPYYEKVNRKYVLEYLPKKSLMMFSQDNIALYEKFYGSDFSSANTFSIGVIETKNISPPTLIRNDMVRICAVGRLVDFKTYNYHLINVIKKLIDNGNHVQLDIFGDGPTRASLESEINAQKLTGFVNLKGSFDYSHFNEVVKNYDLFVGTGTAIVQASALGIPSITAIDHATDASSYGYFYKVHNRQYGRSGLNIKHVNMYDIIEKYCILSNEEIIALRQKHLDSTEQFIIKNSVHNIEKLNFVEMPAQDFVAFSVIRYEVSRLISKIKAKFNRAESLKRLQLPKV